MNLIVDTSVWSLFLRRKNLDEKNLFVKRLRYHLEREDCVHLVGVVLQELLDGVKIKSHFELIDDYLRPFPLIEHTREDYIEAAKIKTTCRQNGIQAATIDFLIASTCLRRNYPLLTADEDFSHISEHCELVVIDV